MTTRRIFRITAWIPGFFITALLFTPGCGSNDPGDPASDQESAPPPPSELVQNLGEVYTLQLTNSLATMLHPDFQMILPSETC